MGSHIAHKAGDESFDDILNLFMCVCVCVYVCVCVCVCVHLCKMCMHNHTHVEGTKEDRVCSALLLYILFS